MWSFIDHDEGSLDLRWRPYCVVALLFAAGCAGVWLERETVLRGAAELWIVSDPVDPADAIVVLGGGIDIRPFVAAELYAKGLAKRVLVSEIDEGVLPRHTENNKRVLARLGVPGSSIETFGIANRNTFEEAVALRDWTLHNAVSALIIPTEVFSARRVRWTFRREFAGTAVRIEVPSFEPSRDYSRGEWWKTEAGVLAFHNEVVKYIYYRLKY